MTWQDGILFSGLSVGTAPDSPEAWHAGAFAGLSGGSGPVVLTAGGGLFRNQIRRDARFWSRSDLPALDSLLGVQGGDSVYAPDSSFGWRPDWEIRLTGGMLFRLHPQLAPYLLVEGGVTRFWPKPNKGPGGICQG